MKIGVEETSDKNGFMKQDVELSCFGNMV